MTSTSPVPADDAALSALPADEPVAPQVTQRVVVGMLPLALIAVIVLLFIAAAWTLVAAGA